MKNCKYVYNIRTYRKEMHTISGCCTVADDVTTCVVKQQQASMNYQSVHVGLSQCLGTVRREFLFKHMPRLCKAFPLSTETPFPEQLSIQLLHHRLHLRAYITCQRHPWKPELQLCIISISSLSKHREYKTLHTCTQKPLCVIFLCIGLNNCA